VRYRGEVTSLLFLEHAEVAGVFTEERIGLLKLLLSQAAVSLHNAQLFDNLERRVADRTEALAEALEQTRVSHQKLVESQKRLLISDRLAVLGQLVAGVAHELNTPLGAIGAASDNLVASVASMIEAFWRVVASATAEELESLAYLVKAASRETTSRTSREMRAARRELVRDLERREIDEPDAAADLLVGMGVTELAAELSPALSSRSRRELLAAAADIATLRRGVADIQDGARRMSRIVFALKSYANPGGREQRSEGSLAANLDNVLALYAHQLRAGFEVVRDYSCDTTLEAVHDQMNQVWTNLVHNALSAMGRRGMLTVRVEESGEDHLAVTIGDTGPGVPEELRARIFEAFFTTKSIGEGSGLGLSICKDIVTAHGGTITVESRPGDTRFTVRLPLRGGPSGE
jgi:signal transduction histidine kinase